MFFLKLHPLLVHFPIGLLITGVLLHLYAYFQKEDSVRIAAQFNIQFGFYFSLFVSIVGLAGYFFLEIQPNFESFLNLHFGFAMSSIVIFSLALLVKRFWSGKGGSFAHTLFLIIGLAGILATGYFGGELVHRFGVSTLHPVAVE